MQNLRIKHALKGLSGGEEDFLDYGAGNGEMLKLFSQQNISFNSFHIYEPTEKLMSEAKSNLHNLRTDKVQLFQNIADCTNKYDVIFCLEAFEHLTEETIVECLNMMALRLKPDGKIILGVPNELYMMAFCKGLFRTVRRPGDYDTHLSRIIRSSFGNPPKDRPIDITGNGLPYCYYHMGFDYPVLSKTLSGIFKIQETYGSPFTKIPIIFNSEVYFVLTHQS